MGSCHIAHDCKVGNNNILANSTLLAGHVVVEVIDYSSLVIFEKHDLFWKKQIELIDDGYRTMLTLLEVL